MTDSSSNNPNPPGEFGGSGPTPDEKNWGLVAHLAWLPGSLICGLYFLGPLVVYLMKKDESAFVKENALEALNLAITGFLAAIVAFFVSIPFMLVGIPPFLPGLIGIAYLVLSIMAAVEVSNGKTYRYPYILRLVK